MLRDNIRLREGQDEGTRKEDEGAAANHGQHPAPQGGQAKTGPVIKISDKACNILAELDGNGRDIRNIIRTAMSIANSDETVIGPQYVLTVIKSLSNARNKMEIVQPLESISSW